MARRPVHQHRALAAVRAGRVVRIKTGLRLNGSWQWWSGERWRPVDSAENKALDTLIAGAQPRIEVTDMTQGGVREHIGLTHYGEVSLRLWDHEWGPRAMEELA